MRYGSTGVVAVVLGVLGMVAGGTALSQTAPPGMKTYADKELGFTIHYPPDWRAQKDFQEGAAVGILSPNKVTAIVVQTMEIPEGHALTLDEWAKEGQERLANSIENFKVVETVKVKVGDVPGIRITSTGKIEERVGRTYHLLASTDRRRFMVTAFVTDALAAKTEPIIKSILNSLSIKGGKPAAADDPEVNPFADAGFAPTDRAWRGGDYQRTAEILKSGKAPLPKWNNPHGKAILERLTNVENLSMLRNKKFSVRARLTDWNKILEGDVEVLQLYVTSGREDVETEVAMMSAFLLHAGVVGIDLANEELINTPEGERREARMAGLKKAQEGVLKLFKDSQETVVDRDFPAAGLSAYLEAMACTLPTIKPIFTAEYREELQKKLEEVKPKYKGREDVARIDRMLDELKRS